jgi:hypothetical protein
MASNCMRLVACASNCEAVGEDSQGARVSCPVMVPDLPRVYAWVDRRPFATQTARLAV